MATRARPRRRPKWRPRLHRLSVAAGIAALLLLGAFLLFRHGIELDLERFRPRIEAALEAQLGTPVRLGGVRARVAPWTELWVEDGAIGEPGSEWLQVQAAQVRLALLPLLRRRELRFSRLDASEIVLDSTREPPRPPPREPQDPESTVRLVELQRLELEDVEVVLAGSEGEQASLQVAHLELVGLEGEPVEFSMRGGFFGPRAALDSIEVEGTGGSLLEAQGIGFWPYRLELHRPGIDLAVEGEVAALGVESREDAQQAFRTQIETDSLAELLVSLGAPTDSTGLEGLTRPASLSLDGHWNHERLSADVDATVAGDSVGGELELSRVESSDRDGRLLLSGELRAERVSLESWSPRSDGSEAADTTRLKDWRDLDLVPVGEALEDIGLDLLLDLKVAEVSDPRFELSALEARLDWRESSIELPFTANLEGSPIEATANVGTGSTPGLRLSARSRDVRLRRWWDGAAPSDRVSRMALEATSVGSTLGEWVDALQFEGDLQGLVVADLRRQPDLAPVPLDVTSLTVTQQDGLTLSSHAKVLGRDLEVSLSTALLGDLLRGGLVPLRADLRGKEGRATVEGQLGVDRWYGSQLAVELYASHIGRFSDWIGVSEALEIPVELQGKVAFMEDGLLEIEAPLIRLGRSSGSISARWRDEDQHLELVAESPLIDLEELQGDGDSPAPAEEESVALASWRDLPLFPEAIERWRGSIDLRVEQLRRHGVDPEEVRLHLELAEGATRSSSVGFEIGAAPFRGEWSVDRRGSVPELRLSAETRNLDLGALLESEGALEGLDVEIGRVAWQGVSRGATLGELVDSGSHHLELENGVYWLDDETGSRREAVRVDSAVVEGVARDEMTASGRGSFRETPLDFELETLSLARAASRERLPFDLRLEAPEAEIRLQGELAPDVEVLELNVEAEGDSLAALGPLFAVELPTSEPFRLSGRLQQQRRQWSLADLTFEWGGSRLVGHLELDLEPERPRLRGAIESPRLRVVDLLPEASLEESPVAAQVTDEVATKETEEGVELPEPFVLESNPLPELDLELELRLTEVELPDGASASGSGRIRMDRTALEVALDSLDANGGSGGGQLRFEPDEGGTRLSIEASVDGFDYSAVADRFSDYSAEEGTMGFYIDLDAEAAWGTPLLAEANGEVAFLVQPEHFEALALDLWAADLATSLIPSLGWADSPSTVNCLALFVSFEDGVSDDLRAILDTRRVRVNGRGKLDLGARSIDLKLKPKPKRRALLSLATPVRIRGSEGDYSVRVTSSGWIWTLVRVQAYIYTLYLQVLKRPLPADGTEACLALFQGKVEDNEWRPGKYLTQPDTLIEDVVEGPSSGHPP